MSKSLIGAYQYLPPWAQSVAATARGAYLRCWRYDGRTEGLVCAALDRELWPRERWVKWQEERLAYILHRAANEVPYYRQYWEKHPLGGESFAWRKLANWPILEKEELRKNPRAFVADGCRTRLMFAEHTSGTSGTPLSLWRSRKTQMECYALLEARMRRWHGVSRHDRWAILGGQLIAPVSRRTPPFWVWNPALHQLYMSSFHLSPEFAHHYLDAIKRYKVKYLLGYPSALEFLARAALRHERSDLKMEVILTNAEPVSHRQRAIICEAFQCSLRDSYGMAEMVAAGSECSEGTMHLWPEIGTIEVVNEDAPVPHGVVGDLICTGLLNDDMPLIRYRVGDRGAVDAAHTTACRCGRGLPSLASVEGRVDDVVCTREGRRIGRLDPVFKGGFPILEAQVIQEGLNRLRVRYVPSQEFSHNSAQELKDAVRKYVGPMEITLEPMARIPREANGKFRAVISRLSREERETWRGAAPGKTRSAVIQ